MSGQTGFNYEVMISRLHGGLCAFQSLRAHRRQREQAVVPAASTERRAPEERVTPPPPRATPVDEQVTGSPEPQAFVAMGDRVVPLFGSLNGLFGGAPAPSATAPTVSAPPPAAPAPPAEETRPPQSATAPTPNASTLKLPPPMPPPRLGLIYGGHPSPPDPAPNVATDPSSAAPRTSTHEPAPRPQDPAQAQETPSLASITALLDSRAQADAQRLEQVHAEHRAVMAITLREHRDELCAQVEAEAARTAQLLCAHRDELRAQREADATRTAQLLREVFAEHRADLARAHQTRADHLAQLLAQQQHAAPNATTDNFADLKAALLEQASLQREANEATTDQISALTAIVADLGQTVGMLAVAAVQKAQQSHPPTRPTFLPPRHHGPTTPPRADLIAVVAAPQRERVASTIAPQLDPATTRVEPTAPIPANTTPPAANQPKTSPTQTRVAAAERARLQEALEDDSDDDIADLTSDDDDAIHRHRLPPITALESPGDQGHDDV